MSEHNETGKKGEAFALEYLVKKGYRILELNWRFQFKEIDIIAQHDGRLIFVEVKTRATLAFELPKEAVTLKKKRHIVFAADAYIQQKEIDLESRFDIISVLATEPMQILEHIEDAFRPNDLI